MVLSANGETDEEIKGLLSLIVWRYVRVGCVNEDKFHAVRNCGTVVVRLIYSMEWAQVGAALSILAMWDMMDFMETLSQIFWTFNLKHLRHCGFCIARIYAEVLETFHPEKMELRCKMECAGSSLAELMMTE